MRQGKFSKKAPPEVSFPGFQGWEIQTDVLSRTPNSFRRLENVDLFTPGSIRKVVGPSLLQWGYPSEVIEFFSHRPHPTDPITAYAIGMDGNLYNLMNRAFVANLSPSGFWTVPFVTLFQGTTAGGATIQYSVITRPGDYPVKFDGAAVTPVGVSAPSWAIDVTLVGQSATQPPGIQVQVARQYEWTYWNPVTLHESSPSPVEWWSIIKPSGLYTNAATPYLTEIALTVPTAPPTDGVGYTMIRIYATRDGGATFFLVPQLYDWYGNMVSDANGAVPIQGPTSYFSDGFAASSIPPTADPSLITPAPSLGQNGPPPIGAVWGAVYQSRLWLLDPDLSTLWFSNIGDFESYGAANYFRFVSLVLNDITALIPLSDRLIVANKNSTAQITGTDFSDFAEVPVDPVRGIVGRRAGASLGASVIALTLESLAQMGFQQAGSPFVGDRIKPFTDTIDPASFLTGVQVSLYTELGMMMVACKVNGAWVNDKLIVISIGKQSPFSLITGLPAEVITMHEVILPDMQTHFLLSMSNLAIYDLYGGGGSLTAVAETQKLPLEDLDVDKYFQSFWAQGTDLITGWTMAVSVDDNPFTQDVPLVNSNMVGYVGREIVLRFTHAAANGVPALLSRGTLRHLPMTAAR